MREMGRNSREIWVEMRRQALGTRCCGNLVPLKHANHSQLISILLQLLFSTARQRVSKPSTLHPSGRRNRSGA
jgi:hypothetical protein